MQQLNITHFESLESFAKLQLQFRQEDFIYKQFSNPDYNNLLPIPKLELLKDDFYINVQIPSQLSPDSKELQIKFSKIYFYESHLPLVVKSLATDYLEDFYDFIREELLENQKERRKFLTEQKKYISSIFENINQFEFIGLSLLNELKAQIIEIEKAVHSPTLYNDKYIGSDRILIEGWTKIDIIALFYYLRKEKVIEDVSDIKFGNFLERIFYIKENGNFETLKDVNKKLSDIKSGSFTIDKSTKRLKCFFEKLQLKDE